MSNSDWKKVYATGILFDAELIKSKLIDEGIECKTLNKKDSAYLFGEIELYVQAKDVVRAKHVISNMPDRE
ncbi:MAG: DUF2007 domain-containing protein [Bacteroidales bacterium]|nr:DUF2007 domain-containing protein [Bacteroidales bacterium]